MAQRRDVIRAQLAIGQAYYELLFQKKKEKITVRDILEKANFSHGTFYAHFRDIEDLEEQLEGQIVQNCRKVIQQKSQEDSIREPSGQVELCLECFEDHREEIRAFVHNHNETGIVTKLKLLMNEALRESWEITREPEQSAVLCSCITGALVDACIEWVASENAVDRSEFIQIVSSFLSGGIQSVRQAQNGIA